MRFQLPTVDIDLLCTTADACQLALDLVAALYEPNNVAQAQTDLTTMRNALSMQVDYGERGIRTTVKPRVGVMRTARGDLCNEAARDAWQASHPYGGPTAVEQVAQMIERCGIDVTALVARLSTPRPSP